MSATTSPGPSDGGRRPLAVVTGASSGIGLALAHGLAERGHDLVVCAEDDDVAGLRADPAPATAVSAVRADLATSDGVDRLVAAVEAAGAPVDVLALNAGVGLGGPFLEADLADHEHLVELDVLAVVRLAHRLLPAMVARGAGRVLVTSSVAATMPGPWYATYAASKTFVQSFTEALRHELRGSGVTLTALQPGPTDTAFFERADMTSTLAARGPKSDPADVARAGLEALFAGDDHVVVGALGKSQAAMARVLPVPAQAAVHGAATRPRGG
ncbi:SDR family NAD(P)-dependent oxidoreductase [Actinotalea solisilvae]|uniref:SDR family NAD(P)-dependent oxidoreductase n=1 Tax=Actinotalea solisilvae TaxID=2072922 RepID=UPI0018F15120|nr:SDR family NAD(P)-dependent oxidoreductase [Actinotalea solisilvae]